ncbi:MAG: hypothetical protein ACKV0T_12375 [Planctomycetales bacterium]
MLHLSQSPTQSTIRHGHYRLEFRHVQDRWQHELAICCQDRWRPILTSREGTPAEVVPASPVWQDLRLESLSDDVAEFQLMGQAGEGVYSAAIRLDGSRREVFFDLCARGKRGDSSICQQCRYDLSSETLWREGSNSLLPTITGHFGAWGLHVEPHSLENQPQADCRLEGTPAARLIVGCLEGAGKSDSSRGRSVRWQYRISLDGEP